MVRIVTDSASDIETNMIEEWEITCAPLSIIMNDEVFKENVDISKTDFYERLISSSDFPKTSQVPPHEFEAIFKKAKAAGDDVVAVLLSSSLSGTYQSAVNAARSVYGDNYEGEGCYLINSCSASAGELLLVEQAVILREEGKSAKEIADTILHLCMDLRLYACVNTLEYLHRGGRISKVAAAIGSIVKVKPVLFVNQKGTPEIIARIRGQQKAVRYLTEQLQHEIPDERYPIYLMYSYVDEAAQQLRKSLRLAGYQIRMKHLIHAGAVIGSHVGPNAFGLVYVRKNQ